MKLISTAEKLMESWNVINLQMELYMVRPYKIACLMDRKLSSRITISPASLATSVPLPMANPTSARFRAGESLTPSPVMPVTRFISWAILTRRSLSRGSARDTTLRSGRFNFTSSSDMAASS